MILTCWNFHTPFHFFSLYNVCQKLNPLNSTESNNVLIINQRIVLIFFRTRVYYEFFYYRILFISRFLEVQEKLL